MCNAQCEYIYLIIDVPTLRQIMQIMRERDVYRAVEREKRKKKGIPVVSRAEAVSLCGLITLFNDGRWLHFHARVEHTLGAEGFKTRKYEVEFFTP